MTPAFWQGKRVLLTGHTGFKGSWLALWLQRLGAQVSGFALDPLPGPQLFELARVGEGMHDRRGDIRDADALNQAFEACQPEVVFHLAAQPLVGESYRDPAGTWASNVTGTLNLLEALRRHPEVRACVIVTTDKIYANSEWAWPYRENDPLGGHDPYSSSKAACELLVQSWRASFFAPDSCELGLATARAGNVIGGGDFTPGRLLPDVLAAWGQGQPVALRNALAVRPWQHVLEALAGYLLLAESLHAEPQRHASAWNFGPLDADTCSVGELVQRLQAQRDSAPGAIFSEAGYHEAGQLRLDSSRARQVLGWAPRWKLQQTLTACLEWDSAHRQGQDLRGVTLAQIQAWEGHA